MVKEVNPNPENFTVNPLEICDDVQTGMLSYNEVTEQFLQSFLFYGKTLTDWVTELMIPLPNQSKDISEKEFRSLLLRLSKNLQIATNYHSIATIMAEAIGGGRSIKRSDLIAKIVESYALTKAKRPAATVIQQMADSYLGGSISSNTAAKIVKTFWKQRIDALLEIRKTFELIGVSLHVEIKWSS